MGLFDIKIWLIQQQCNIEFFARDIKYEVDYLFRDRKLEAEKKGYVEATQKYQPLIQDIEKEYSTIIKLFSMKKEQYEKKLDELTAKLYELKEKRDSLKSELYKKYYSSFSQVKLGTGDMPDIWESDSFEEEDFYNDFFQIKLPTWFEWMMKLFTSKKDKAWMKGYSSAKSDCLKKIKQMQDKYEESRRELFKDDDDYLKLINESLKEITKLSVEIIQLISISE